MRVGHCPNDHRYRVVPCAPYIICIIIIIRRGPQQHHLFSPSPPDMYLYTTNRCLQMSMRIQFELVLSRLLSSLFPSLPSRSSSHTNVLGIESAGKAGIYTDGDRDLLVCNVLPVSLDEIKQNAFLFSGFIWDSLNSNYGHLTWMSLRLSNRHAI